MLHGNIAVIIEFLNRRIAHFFCFWQGSFGASALVSSFILDVNANLCCLITT